MFSFKVAVFLFAVFFFQKANLLKGRFVLLFYLQGSIRKCFEDYSSGHLPESDITENHASLYKYCILALTFVNLNTILCFS